MFYTLWVLEPKCGENFMKVTRAHQCPFFSEIDEKNAPTCGMEMTTAGFVLFGTEQKTHNKHTVRWTNSKETVF